MSVPLQLCLADAPEAVAESYAGFMAMMARDLNALWAEHGIGNVAIVDILWSDRGDEPPVVTINTKPGEATDGQLTVMRLRAFQQRAKRDAPPAQGRML